ncbi:glycosyltransferase [Marinobacter sp. LV10MA510-1]|uniref:glycosyltransferase n=1 Tax=Marinobacter sp. LV10MA510-1 TaxID=1415567 RepID=UPI000BF3DB41|nr:glycosyltransferase [Marinobacter sp. LV10MA510-1]PFG07921.1 glycosyltransferase involved in cell wall biosynthesis [Marinobacter sp. LV10MA510-1]
MNEAKRICVMMARYAISGVPLAQIRLAKALAERGYDVDLVVGFVSEEYTMPKVEGVNTILLDTPQARDLLPILIKYLRRRNPDGFFTAEDHLNAIVLISAILARSKVKISASSRVTPFDTYSNRPFTKRWLLKQIMRAVMWRADVLTCVSKGMVEQYRTIFCNARHECIYNIVRTPSAQKMIIEPVDHPWFSDRALPVLVAAGQLGPWKGFTDLIRSVHILSTRRPVRLILLGDGPQRSELEDLIEELGLQDNVRLEGHVANPLKYFAHADVFVLSSLLEGMPNVLIEAMMAGCTPVATDCPTGPNEILGDGRYGYLVPMSDPDALADGIEKAIINPISPEVLSEALVPFEKETVVEQHLRKLNL